MIELKNKLNQYFELMEQIRSDLFRVVEVSDRYMCLVSFNTQLQAVQCDLVSRESMLPAKLLEGLTGTELVNFGNVKRAIEQWAASGMEGDFPIKQGADIYEQYRKAVQPDPEPVFTEDEAKVMNASIASEIREATRDVLLLMVDDTEMMDLEDDSEANNFRTWPDVTLRAWLFDHYNIKTDENSVRESELVEYVSIMPKSQALRFITPMSKHSLSILVDAYGLERCSSAHDMVSLLKGYILRK